MRIINYLQLSKEISYILRHSPWEYGLELDRNGWVSLEKLLNGIKQYSKWENATKKDLYYIVENSDKKRHEIFDGKIRALYGHSIPEKILKESKDPPTILFHGTARRVLDLIESNGLLHKGRQYVHLSTDIQTAFQVGKRRDNNPVILEINAKQAWSEGIKFYVGNDKVWLADNIPCKYIKVK